MERVCGKKPYANRRDAERECTAMRRKHRDGSLQTYYCRGCEAYHFGHRMTPRQRVRLWR